MLWLLPLQGDDGGGSLPRAVALGYERQSLSGYVGGKSNPSASPQPSPKGEGETVCTLSLSPTLSVPLAPERSEERRGRIHIC